MNEEQYEGSLCLKLITYLIILKIISKKLAEGKGNGYLKVEK